MYLGSIEEVDTVVPCSLHAFLDDVTLLGTTVCEPATWTNVSKQQR